MTNFTNFKNRAKADLMKKQVLANKQSNTEQVKAQANSKKNLAELKDYKYDNGQSFSDKLSSVRLSFMPIYEVLFEKDGIYDKSNIDINTSNDLPISVSILRGKSLTTTVGRLRLLLTQLEKIKPQLDKEYQLLENKETGLVSLSLTKDLPKDLILTYAVVLANIESSDALKKAKSTYDSLIAYPTVEKMRNSGIVELVSETFPELPNTPELPNPHILPKEKIEETINFYAYHLNVDYETAKKLVYEFADVNKDNDLSFDEFRLMDNTDSALEKLQEMMTNTDTSSIKQEGVNQAVQTVQDAKKSTDNTYVIAGVVLVIVIVLYLALKK